MADRPSDANCVFCKIVAGDVPCHKVYEDEQVLAFLDIAPLSAGHTVIIPKAHHVTLDQLPAEALAALGRAAGTVGPAVADSVDCDGWNVLQNNGEAAGQVVMHVHFHIIPRTAGDNLGYRWPAGKLDHDKAPQLAEAIRGRLG